MVISQPFWPGYLTEERIAKAKYLKLAITAGIGSDHVDLQAAIDRGITVAEVTYCNSISVAEHVVMMILALARNYLPSWEVVKAGGWNIADCASRSYDIEGMHIGTVAAGRIGRNDALTYGVVLSVFSVMLLGMASNWLAGGLLALTITYYAGFYTLLLKRRTPQNIVIGGAAGAFPPVIGWAAATGQAPWQAWLLFLIIFLWTPPHSRSPAETLRPPRR